MTNEPAKGDSPDPENPFKGTPFEQIFNAFGSGQMPDLSALMAQFQSLMTPYDGPVNWTLAHDTARKLAAQEPDPTPSRADRDGVADAVRLADHWLDAVTALPSGVTVGAAWSRAEWIEETLPVWQKLVSPIAQHLTGAMGNALPDEAKTMAGPMLGMLGSMGGSMFGAQVGQGLGALAGEVLTASEIGLPLGPSGQAALVTANITAFAEGLDVGEPDVVLYLALRECAHQRLFAHVPWLRDHLLPSVEAFAAGMTIDVSGIESAMQDFDPSNPAAIGEALEGGLFEPKPSPAQAVALQRLETTIALIEGWVDEVVGQATAQRMPVATKLAEAFRRRRAAGGPAEQTFGALVGLELRPRRMRDAATLWGSLRDRFGVEGREAVWVHPDLLPTATDLDDPLGFRADLQEPEALSDEEFDKALHDLLESEGE
ncbi:MAG TPA: zinc-dependent metalloprotease [Marmoricola sp.]|nr:zinc-dependent metalloprotease [Marmoricola sp.]